MPRRQQGLTLTELMVGTAVGLIVTSAVLTVYVSTIKSSSDSLKAAALSQQLRATMDVMLNDIRRTGFWGTAASGTVINPFSDSTTDLTVLDSGTCVLYSYDRDVNGAVDSNEYLGFKLDDNAVRMRSGGTTTADCGNGSWQDVTDKNTVIIDALTFTTEGGKCKNVTTGASWTVGADDTNNPCGDTDNAAGAYVAPSLGDNLVETRQINITLTGHLKSDTSVTKSVTGSVRIRNDRIY